MKHLVLLFLIGYTAHAYAQLPPSPDSSWLLKLNERIDDLVTERNTAAVDSLYADDFVFSHGSGRIEGKAGWMKTVARGKYLRRNHDSVRVQQHGNIAVLRGQMYIERQDAAGVAKYRLWYIRVYARRKGHWRLVSHTTVNEIHY